MRVLSENEYKIFKHLVSLTQLELQKTLELYLKKKYKQVIVGSKYLIAVGDIPIALVAHMDTVFPHPVAQLYYDQRQGVLWSPDGLGADDRAGVFSIISILQSGLRPSIIFTADEESGGIGAQLLSKLPCPIENVKYLIQLDRRGTNDCVFYDCNNFDFIHYISSFGFVEAMGTFSDISFLMPAWKICGVNLSVGYENEHDYIETLNINTMFSTIEKVKTMLKAANEAPYFEYQESKDYLTNWYKEYINQDYYSDEELMVTCSCCGNSYFSWEMISVKDPKNGAVKFFCPECQIDHVDWCENCGRAYEVIDPHTDINFCKNCMEELNV